MEGKPIEIIVNNQFLFSAVEDEVITQPFDDVVENWQKFKVRLIYRLSRHCVQLHRYLAKQRNVAFRKSK